MVGRSFRSACAALDSLYTGESPTTEDLTALCVWTSIAGIGLGVPTIAANVVVQVPDAVNITILGIVLGFFASSLSALAGVFILSEE